MSVYHCLRFGPVATCTSITQIWFVYQLIFFEMVLLIYYIILVAKKSIRAFSGIYLFFFIFYVHLHLIEQFVVVRRHDPPGNVKSRTLMNTLK